MKNRIFAVANQIIMTSLFKIHYHAQWGETLAIVLNDKKYQMTWSDGDIWQVKVKNYKVSALKDYHYIVLRDGIIMRTEWSKHSSEASEEIIDKWIECPIPGCPFPRKHQAELFDEPRFRGAGTAVPVFSLRSKNDFGIGEFNDLLPLIDWAAATGQCIIQLLPVNDTTRNGGWQDSYPYSPISSFALHPLYVNLQEIGVKQTAKFKQEQAELNALDAIDYPKVFAAKMKYLRSAYKDLGVNEVKGRACKKFIKDNSYWLEEYACFCANRDNFDKEFYYWVQFHLDKQFLAVAKYARSKGIHLKGDLPIGVSADSAEAYYHPELFNLDSTAGAPPDYFSADGQNWGFPTYNWDAMAVDNYAWWKSRLRKMACYFDAFRIDHILGFFRIWEIPIEESSGMYGHFNPALPYSLEEIKQRGLPIEGLFHEDPRHPGMYQPFISPDSAKLPAWQQESFGAMYNDFFFCRHNSFWKDNALKKLPELLSATGMLACGEDLGMIPDCVPEVMDREKILSLKMRGMVEGGCNPISVCATSSHDMVTLRQQFSQDLRAWEVKKHLRDMLAAPSILAIFPIQDWLGVDENLRRKDRDEERINDPANPHHHWKFRIHLDLEQIKFAGKLNAEICGLLKDSGRYRFI